MPTTLLGTLSLVFALMTTSILVAEDSNIPATDLAAYVGRDVGKMNENEKSKFVAVFRKAIGDGDALKQEKDWAYVPQTLYEFAKPSSRFFVEIAPGFDRPGFCALRIHYFDDAWKFVRSDIFSTGYRQETVSVKKKYEKQVGTDVLIVKTTSAGPWQVDAEGNRLGTPFFSGKHQLQYYAVVDDGLMLVRREDENGKLILNSYSNWSIPEIGKNYPKGSTDELLAILRSESAPRRLALLVWLSGKHMASIQERVKGVSQEPIESSKSYERIMASSECNDVIRDLGKSGNKWIAEYASSILTAAE